MIADKSCPEVRPRLAYAPEKVFTAFAKAALVTGWLTPSPEIRLTVLKFDFREAFGKSTIESDLALHIAAAPCILRFRQIARILLSLLQFGQTKIRLVWFKGVREERILLDRSV